MAILERTPPRRRPYTNGDMDLLTSSPSRSKLVRSSERQGASNTDTYIFPSLEALAAPIRERNAAMSLAARNTPTLNSITKSRDSIDASGGIRGTSSANSRKVLGGQVGRNRPVLSFNVSKLCPAMGENKTRDSQSPRPTTLSSIPRLVLSPKNDVHNEQRSASSMSREQSPSKSFYPALPNSPSRERQLHGQTRLALSNIDKDFEAQMERALASGANPFQDRRRDQMRGESRVSIVQRKEQVINESRESLRMEAKHTNELLLSSEPSKAEAESTPRKAAAAMSTPKVATPQSPLRRAKAQDVLPTPPPPPPPPQSPSNRLAKEELAKLRLQLNEKEAQIEKTINDTAVATQELKEKEKLNKKQQQRIQELEGRMLDIKTRTKETTDSALVTLSFQWEAVRVKCRESIARQEESREREIDSIISRNEISYLDARRAEGELDLAMQLWQVERLKGDLVEMSKQKKMLKVHLNDVEAERQTLLQERMQLETSESKAKEALRAEQEKREAVEDELREVAAELDEEKAEAQRRKQKQSSSPVKKTALSSDTRKQSPVRNVGRALKGNASPEKVVQTSKTTKGVSEVVRQSPRKKLSALVRSTSAKFQSSVSRMSDSFPEDEQQEDDDDVYQEARKVSTTSKVVKGKDKSGKVQKKKVVSDDEDDNEEHAVAVEEEEREQAVPIKKKGGILSRAKKAGEAMAIKSRGQHETRHEEARMEQLECSVQKTPMIPSKKKMGKVEPANEKKMDEVSDVDATPIVKPKTKSSKTKEQQLLEESTKTPMMPAKKRNAVVEAVQEEHEPSSKTEVQKKKKRRILKQSTNVANGFLNCNGEEGDLDPQLNLPLQLSPIKGLPSSSKATIGGRGGITNANRIFGR